MSIRPPPDHPQVCTCADCRAWEEEVRADFVAFCEEAAPKILAKHLPPRPTVAEAGSEMSPLAWRDAVTKRLAEYDTAGLLSEFEPIEPLQLPTNQTSKPKERT